MSNQIPEFPIPTFDAATGAFGPYAKSYLTREQLGDWYGCYGANSRTPYHKAVESMFGRGGKLSDYGLKWKDGVDKSAAAAALRALMSSYAPKHEIKIGTCAVLLANHCDLISPDAEAKL